MMSESTHIPLLIDLLIVSISITQCRTESTLESDKCWAVIYTNLVVFFPQWVAKHLQNLISFISINSFSSYPADGHAHKPTKET